METQTEFRCLHMLVSGTVQGVGFRYYVQQQAQDLQLTVWVRNRLDERVEILAVGPLDQLQKLASLVRIGPRNGLVTDLDIEWMPPQQVYTRFSIAPTA